MSDLASIPKRYLPVWVREKRQPTKAELAAKHFADGGGMGSSSSTTGGNSLGDDDTPEIKVKRYT
jgi:hypothetical protein